MVAWQLEVPVAVIRLFLFFFQLLHYFLPNNLDYLVLGDILVLVCFLKDFSLLLVSRLIDMNALPVGVFHEFKLPRAFGLVTVPGLVEA